MAAENGPGGWRRCPRGGHRMAVVAFVPAPDDPPYLRRRVLREVVGGRRLRFPFEDGERNENGGGDVRVCAWVAADGRRVERLVAADVAVAAAAAATTGGSGGGDDDEGSAEGFPPDGGTGFRAVAGWGWVPAAGVEDELMFPKGAEISEVEDVNGEWFHGFYMGNQGLFPAPYVRVVGR